MSQTALPFLSPRPNWAVRLMRRFLYGVLIPRQRKRKVTRDGLLLRLGYGSVLERRTIRSGLVYEREQLEFFFAQAREWQAEVFLDIGSYFGYYSLIAAKSGLFNEIHAVEAMPENYEKLQWHVTHNGFDKKITAHNVAASDKDGTINFIRSMTASRATDAAADEGIVTIPCARVDSLVNYRGRRLAIKMDVEAHEIAALKGAHRLLAENDIFLQIEILPHKAGSINYLCDNGFELVHYIKRDFYFKRAAQSQPPPQSPPPSAA